MLKFITLALSLIFVVIVSAACVDASFNIMRHNNNNNNNNKKKTSSSSFSSPADLFAKYNFTGVASIFQQSSGGGTAGGGVRWLDKKFGCFDPRYQHPNDNKDCGGVEWPDRPRYPIASNTKLYVAISLLQLHERGHIKTMDDDIADYITQADFEKMGIFPAPKRYCPVLQNSSKKMGDEPSCQSISFNQLLSMSSGLPNGYPPLGGTSQQFLPFPGSVALVAGHHIQQKLLFVPGTKFYYSNAAFEIGSFFVEKFSNMTFQNYLKRNVFDPVGISTYFDAYDGAFSLDRARVPEYYQYIIVENNNSDKQTGKSAWGRVASEFNLGSAAGAGGLVATQEDERKLYFSLFNVSGPSGDLHPSPLLSARSVLQLITPRTLISKPNFYYALGLFIFSFEDSDAETKFQQHQPYSPKTHPQVKQIVYEGEIQGSHTSNVFDYTKFPSVMAQVYSSVIAFFPTEEQWSKVATVGFENGNWWQVTKGFQSRSDRNAGLQTIAFDLIDYFFPA